MAHCEVYILNYNGAAFLPACLQSLEQVELREHSLSVNVVDNGSRDNSKELLANQFPQFNYIDLGFNHGFSKGNNLGVIHRRKALKNQGRKADFHIFLNNDTVVLPNWLVGALQVFEKDQRVGIVGSKSLFHDKFVMLELETENCFSPTDYGSTDSRTLGFFLHSQLNGENIFLDYRRSKIPDAFSGEGHGHWLPQKSRFYVAIKDPTQPAEIQFTLENHHPEVKENLLRLRLNNSNNLLGEYHIEHYKPQQITLSLKPEQYIDVVQNAGSFVTKDWFAGDRGFLEIDCGQYDKEENAAAICGVSLFIRDFLWQKLDGFDQRYFAYYEDTDLSLRARLMGYRCVYSPQSILRHIHCGSSVEYSDYFNRNVAFSHLIFSSKMMNRADWREKTKTCRSKAKEEFSDFQTDFSLEHKPHLRAYCRFLKQRPFFAANRVYNMIKRPEKHLFGTVD